MSADWRPIETAPKDGTQVDLWCRRIGLSTGSYGRVPDCWFSDGKWWMNDEAHGDDMLRSEVANATHWVPRPPPPQRGRAMSATDAEIDAAAKAIRRRITSSTRRWDHLPDGQKNLWRDHARFALEAAEHVRTSPPPQEAER